MLNQLIEMYNNGNSYEDIAKQIGKSKKWVMMKLRGHITPRPARAKPKSHDLIFYQTKTERDEYTCRLYNEGKGAFVISKMF